MITIKVGLAAWTFINESFYENGRWRAWADVPSAVRSAISLERAHEEALAHDAARDRAIAGDIERSHREALAFDHARERVARGRSAREIDARFVIDSYVEGSYPLLFRVGDRALDAGEFTLFCVERFGWTRAPQSLYRHITGVLNEAGIYVRARVSPRFFGRGAGHANVPRSLEEAVA